MAETIKCACSHCGAKYRLSVEAQGRSARCKRCGERFDIPQSQSLEDSILTWLSSPADEEEEDMAPAKPKVISMPASDPNTESVAGRRLRGTIRMKSPDAKEAKEGTA
ncbi:MAG TPA: hypothetical protein PLP66_11065 [Phycisphaerae bacterium]|nr:hypothetical protein [Phycisphaerae bacterium]